MVNIERIPESHSTQPEGKPVASNVPKQNQTHIVASDALGRPQQGVKTSKGQGNVSSDQLPTTQTSKETQNTLHKIVQKFLNFVKTKYSHIVDKKHFNKLKANLAKLEKKEWGVSTRSSISPSNPANLERLRSLDRGTLENLHSTIKGYTDILNKLLEKSQSRSLKTKVDHLKSKLDAISNNLKQIIEIKGSQPNWNKASPHRSDALKQTDRLNDALFQHLLNEFAEGIDEFETAKKISSILTLVDYDYNLDESLKHLKKVTHEGKKTLQDHEVEKEMNQLATLMENLSIEDNPTASSMKKSSKGNIPAGRDAPDSPKSKSPQASRDFYNANDGRTFKEKSDRDLEGVFSDRRTKPSGDSKFKPKNMPRTNGPLLAEYGRSDKPLFKDDSPQIGPLTEENVPQKGPLFKDDAPQSGPLMKENVPQKGPLFKDDAPQSGPIIKENVPQKGPLVNDTPSESSGTVKRKGNGKEKNALQETDEHPLKPEIIIEDDSPISKAPEKDQKKEVDVIKEIDDEQKKFMDGLRKRYNK